jgi:hypothetical protein
MDQHSGRQSPPSVPTSVVEDSSGQNAPRRAVNDFALRLPPPTQRGGDKTHLRIVSEQQKELRRVRNGILEATEQVNVPHSHLGLLWYYTKRILIGPPIATESAERERVTKVKALALLSSDAISSVAYATEAILINLAGAGSGHLGLTLPIRLVIIALLAIVAISYRQTIPAYPNGGGSYIVAKENLGTVVGLVAAAALLIDYVLNVAVSVAAGILVLALLAGLLLVVFKGSTNALINLFAVGVFLSFTLSQAGMVRHWWRLHGEHWQRSMVINGLGVCTTLLVALIIAFSKFLV